MAAAGTVLAGGAQAAKPGNSLNAKACQKGGYAALARAEAPTTAFTSEEECTSYAAKGGTLTAVKTAKEYCESLGGEFDVIWGPDDFQCVVRPALSDSDFTIFAQALHAVCRYEFEARQAADESSVACVNTET